MTSVSSSWIAATGLMLAACGGQGDAASNAAGVEPAANVAATATIPLAHAPADSPTPAQVYTLAANGLEPGLTFGMKQADAVVAATAAFGPPGKTEQNDECGEGPMDFVSFGGLQLGFQDDKLAGWSLSEAEPSLRSAGGLAIGAPRSTLGGAEVDEESSLGPEFEVGGVGGILDEKGRKIVALWAGLTCQFR